MLNCIKSSFNLTNKFIILATPLILFSLFSSLYILFSTGGNLISLLIALVLFFLMLTAFLSGWFFMIKTGIKELDMEDPNALIKEFPAGVGEYFIPTMGMVLNSIIISCALLAVSYFAGMKLIGDIGIPVESFSKAIETTAALKAFLMSLTNEQLFRLNAWNLLLFGTMSLTYFLIMFYPTALFFKEKNPLKALWISLKDLFSRKFFKNVLLYIILFVSYFLLSVFTTIFGGNVVTHFVFVLLNFYYLVFAAMLIFNCYYLNYVKIGANIDEVV